MKRYFVTAIGTDSGKTVVSAALCQALGADYWKPVQAGRPTDTDWVRTMIDGDCHPERYLLNTPASPHYAAGVDGVRISLDDFTVPETGRPLVIEGAGGMLVPLNEKDMVIDLAAHLEAEVILVCDLYLGSINHSLLSIDYLKRRGLSVKGIIFNGEPNASSEEIIERHCPWPVLGRIGKRGTLTKEVIGGISNTLNLPV